MSQYIDPIIFTILVMDRESLEHTNREYRAILQRVRAQYLLIWFRNRLLGFAVFSFYLLLFVGIIHGRDAHSTMGTGARV